MSRGGANKRPDNATTRSVTGHATTVPSSAKNGPGSVLQSGRDGTVTTGGDVPSIEYGYLLRLISHSRRSLSPRCAATRHARTVPTRSPTRTPTMR
jgi:hypothetical protein